MAKKKTSAPEGALVLAAPASLAALGDMFDPSLVSGAATAASGGGIAPFIKVDADEKVLMDGVTEIGDTLDVVILGAAVEHALYPKAYQAGEHETPVCFYVGPSEADAKPDALSTAPQAATCATCAKNAFGSHPSGRGGKACGQRRRLLLLVLGDNDDPSEAPLRRLRVPPTSAKFVDAYVRLILGHGRPVQSVVTTVKLEKDPKNKVNVRFAPKRPLNDRAALEAIARRVEEGKPELFSGWTPKAKQGAVEAKTGRRVVRR